MESPIAQATGHNNYIVNVYEDRVEIKSGWQGQNIENIGHKDVSSVIVKGLVNCTLMLESNTGRVYQITRMARPDANGIKNAIERQKQKAGLYE
ncbi:MAG: hypothetical protein M3N10_11195 [Actinomycetota bacterium]|nr:hypothetical protein [Actinomycetota bacterium]HZY65900.1 hypothetical protein [Rubrobacteraceae bacterium]